MSTQKKSLIRRLFGNLTASSQLSDAGVNPQDKYTFNINQEIPVAKNNYLKALGDMELQQYCNRYEWKGLPNNLTGWLIETMLYYRGSLVWYFQGDDLLALPYASAGKLNVYGLPTSVHPVAYNEQTELVQKKVTLAVMGLGNGSKVGTGALMFDRIPTNKSGVILSQQSLSRQILADMAEILARVKNNIKNADKKIVYYCENEGQKKAFYDAINSCYSADDPFVVVVKGQDEIGIQSEPLHTEVDLETQELIECWQSLNNIRCMIEGLKSGDAFEKKERKITGELEGTDYQTDLVIESGLEMRRLCLEQLKICYPDKLSILDKISVSRRVSVSSTASEDETEDDGGDEDEEQ